MNDFEQLCKKLYPDYPEYDMLPHYQQARLQFLYAQECHGQAYRDVLHEQLWDADGQFPGADSVVMLFWEWLMMGDGTRADVAAGRLKYRAMLNINAYGQKCIDEYNRNYAEGEPSSTSLHDWIAEMNT